MSNQTAATATITQKINIDQYIQLGGKLPMLNYPKTRTTYYDKNRTLAVRNVQKHSVSGNGTQLYMITFENGFQKTLSGMWIETEVETVLSEKYTN